MSGMCDAFIDSTAEDMLPMALLRLFKKPAVAMEQSELRGWIYSRSRETRTRWLGA